LRKSNPLHRPDEKSLIFRTIADKRLDLGAPGGLTPPVNSQTRPPAGVHNLAEFANKPEIY
jgi:hypothetical protein